METCIYLLTFADGCWIKLEASTDIERARIAAADYLEPGESYTLERVADDDSAARKLASIKVEAEKTRGAFFRRYLVARRLTQLAPNTCRAMAQVQSTAELHRVWGHGEDWAMERLTRTLDAFSIARLRYDMDTPRDAWRSASQFVRKSYAP